MRIRLVGILVCILLIAAIVLPVSGNLNINKEKEKKFVNDITAIPSGESWYDSFDLYDNNQPLDGTSDDGGWKGWDNNPSFFAYVVDTQNHTDPHSVEIVGNSDIVHEFMNYSYGFWYIVARVYVPSSFEGYSYFIILDEYYDYGPYHFAVAIRFDSEGFVESEYDGEQLPLITDQWVELRVEIDLDADWFEFYYNSDLLIEKEWTAGVFNYGDGILNIAAVDLYANWASEVYYDNLLLCSGEMETVPVISFTDITDDKLNIIAELENSGQVAAEEIYWKMNITLKEPWWQNLLDGWLFYPKEFPKGGEWELLDDTLGPGDKTKIKIFMLGLGHTTVIFNYTFTIYELKQCDLVISGFDKVNVEGMLLVDTDIEQPVKTWENITPEYVEYIPGLNPYVVLKHFNVNNMHLVRVVKESSYDSGTLETLYQSSSKFTKGFSSVYECHITRDIVLSGNAFWQIQTVNGE